MQLTAIQPYLPTAEETVIGTLSALSAYYFRGIPAALAVITGYGIYRFASTIHRRITVERNLRTEFFKRLPKELKNEILNQTTATSSEAIAELRNKRQDGDDLERLRKIAIAACLEEQIDKKELSYVMLSCMAQEMKNKLPGITFDSTYGKPKEIVKRIVDAFCERIKIPPQTLGNPELREDAFFAIQMNGPLDLKKAYHYTASIAQGVYPFSIDNRRTLYVFPPHIFENLLGSLYENPEKPLAAVGTRRIETFSNNSHRILSMTGGTTVPTPNIEANEALSLTFYLHDCYHLDLDSAMGSDRLFWNALGSNFLKCAKETEDGNMKKALQTLGQFCLDKEFESYKTLPANEAFPFPLIGLYQIAGKEQVDDKEEPFQNIADASFVKKAQNTFIHHFKTFLNEHTAKLQLRPDLSIQGILKSLNNNALDVPIVHEIKAQLGS